MGNYINLWCYLYSILDLNTFRVFILNKYLLSNIYTFTDFDSPKSVNIHS